MRRTHPIKSPLRPSRSSQSRAGFTLLEVLVATAILMVIVLVVSMVFQQSNGAYRSGARRVEEQVVLRGIIGAIARELTLAVDDAEYPPLKNTFSDDKAVFIAMTGTPSGSSDRRAPQQITFSYSGGVVKRNVADLVCTVTQDGKRTWKAVNQGAANESTLNPGPEQKLSDFKFEAVYPDNAPMPAQGLPLRIDIEARITTSGKDSLVSGYSAGKDRKWGTDDDVSVGGR